MATESTGFCQVCQQQRLIRKPSVNHVLHLILTLVTCVWGVIWVAKIVGNASAPYRCSACGSPVKP